MKKWQKRKLRDELICLAIALAGGIVALIHMFDSCPWISLVSAFVLVGGLFAFVDIRAKKYSNR